jgi:hypothetical protein
MRSAVRWLARVIFGLIVLVLVLAVSAIGVLETGWAKNRIRALIVRQADQYLTAHLEIGRLGGSFFSGLQLSGIRLSRDGRTLISIDELEVSYGLGELLQHGIVIRRLAIGGLTVVAGREPDGRWDLANLVKREAQQGGRTGPGRPIEVASIELGRRRSPSRIRSHSAPRTFRRGTNPSTGRSRSSTCRSAGRWTCATCRGADRRPI